MKPTLIALAVSALVAPALAGGYMPHDHGGPPAEASATADAEAAASANNAIDVSAPPMKYAPDVLAPGLTAGINPCVGSVSGGGSGSVFGFVFGTTRRDKNCEMRAMAQQLAQMGQGEAARQLLCQDARVRAAYAAAGTPCDAVKGAFADPPSAPPTIVAASLAPSAPANRSPRPRKKPACPK